MSADQITLTEKEYQRRLEAERLVQETNRTHYDRWRVDVEPIEEEKLETGKWAVSFAQAALRTLGVLHGGALLSLPALVSFFGIAPGQLLMLAAGCYVLGLTAVVAGYLYAFLCVEYLGGSLSHQREVVVTRLNASHAPGFSPLEDMDKKIKKSEAACDLDREISRRNKEIAFSMMIVSLGMFVVGAILMAVSA